MIYDILYDMIYDMRYDICIYQYVYFYNLPIYIYISINHQYIYIYIFILSIWRMQVAGKATKLMPSKGSNSIKPCRPNHRIST